MPLSLHSLILHQIGGMNHFHLNQTFEIDEWIYSRHRGSKGTQPCKSSWHDFRILPVVGNYAVRPQRSGDAQYIGSRAEDVQSTRCPRLGDQLLAVELWQAPASNRRTFSRKKPKGYAASPGLNQPGAVQKPEMPGSVQLIRYDKLIPGIYLSCTNSVKHALRGFIILHIVSPSLAFIRTCWC
jgi:hypothetical protein